MDEPSGRQPLPVAVALDRIRSAYNVGSFFRTGDGANIERLYLCGYTGTPPHRGIAKTALGAEETVPWEQRASAGELPAELRRRGWSSVAIETAPDAIDLFDWTPRFPVCLFFGNEVEGLSAELLADVDERVKLPMLGSKQSLNVAVAGGAALYELVRKYRRIMAMAGIEARDEADAEAASGRTVDAHRP